MTTPTNICNIALARIGAARLNNLQTDSTREARIARDIYDEARRDLLALHHWNFAIKRVQATQSATSPTFGWDNAYGLPDDFIRLISAHPSDSDVATIEYRLEFQDDGDRVIITNADPLYIRYVFDLEDVAPMSPSFRDVLAWRLARDFAAALSKSTSAAELADQAYRRKLSRAKSVDGVEDWPEKLQDGSWLTDRFPDGGI